MQNMSWIQPPGYVHQMIHQTWLPFALDVDAVGGTAPNATLSASAQISEDGRQLRILVANNGTASCKTDVVVNGWKKVAVKASGGGSGGGAGFSVAANVTTLTGDGDDANTPADPTRISPTLRALQWKEAGGPTQVTFPPLSFAVITLSQQ